MSALGFLQLDEICPSVHYEFRHQFIMNISADKVKIRFCVSNAPGFSKRGKRSHHEKKKKACRRSMPVKMLSDNDPERWTNQLAGSWYQSAEQQSCR